MPILQNDTRTATYTNEQAEKLLFGGAQPLNSYRTDVQTDREIATNFDTAHNLDAYKDLVENKYAGSEAVFSSAQPMFSPYATAETRAQNVLEKPTLEGYYTPAAAQFEYDTKTESYYNDDNPLPPIAFKPRIFDNNLQEIDTTNTQMRSFLDLENIGNFDVETETDTQVVAESSEDTATDFVPSLKLNAKGLIAVCSFFIVAALIIALIIINSVSIGSATSRISDLRAQNTAATAELQSATATRESIYETTTKQIERTVKAPGSGYKELTNVKRLPNLKTWEKVVNQDYSTNFFDVLSKFFSGIFH